MVRITFTGELAPHVEFGPIDPDGHPLGLHPERATVTWMSWSDWQSEMEGDG